MTTLTQSTPDITPAETRIRRIDAADLRWALREGWNDFRSMRGDILFAALLYPLIGLIAAAITFDTRLLPLFFPLVAGLSILGPIVSSGFRSEEHTSELQSLMRISYAVFCLKKKKNKNNIHN